ncbi:MAG: TetR/AcrR family transcriptional regulator [Acidimicrobiales bacterium]
MATIVAADAPPLPPAGPSAPIGERLLDAAAEVFAERGYEGAGVVEIARRAGVTTGAIYNRFAGKAELLVAALDAHTSDQLDALFADHRFEGRAEDILTVAGSHLVDRSPDPGEPLLLEAFVASRRDPAVADLLRARVAERHQRLTDIIEAAKAGGGITSDLDTEALVTFCHAVGFGFLLFEALDVPLPAAPPWEQLIAHLVTALAGGPPIPSHQLDPQQLKEDRHVQRC